MAFEQRDNTGALFKNNEKDSDTHPDYRGNLNVDGTEFWLSAWIKTSKQGMKYMSLSIKPKNAEAAKPATSGSLKQDMDDEIPF